MFAVDANRLPHHLWRVTVCWWCVATVAAMVTDHWREGWWLGHIVPVAGAWLAGLLSGCALVTALLLFERSAGRNRLTRAASYAGANVSCGDFPGPSRSLARRRCPVVLPTKSLNDWWQVYRRTHPAHAAAFSAFWQCLHALESSGRLDAHWVQQKFEVLTILLCQPTPQAAAQSRDLIPAIPQAADPLSALLPLAGGLDRAMAMPDVHRPPAAAWLVNLPEVMALSVPDRNALSAVIDQVSLQASLPAEGGMTRPADPRQQVLLEHYCAALRATGQLAPAPVVQEAVAGKLCKEAVNQHDAAADEAWGSDVLAR